MHLTPIDLQQILVAAVDNLYFSLDLISVQSTLARL